MPLPWAAMGIGALIGGLGAKQRGGNFLKGALTGAALGGVGGHFFGKGVGGVGGKGGIFGFGTGWKGSLLPAAMIGMGTEMAGQQEANLKALEGRRRLFQEEEDERLRRLSEIAGYNIADPKNFLTPQSYFSADGGIVNTRKGFYNGGGAFADVPMEEGGPTMDPEIMQLPMGQEGSFESENEDFLELAGLTDEEMAELQSLQSLSIVTPEDHPQYERIQIRLQELLGRLKVAQGGSIERPGYFVGGLARLAQEAKMRGEDMTRSELAEEWLAKQQIKDDMTRTESAEEWLTKQDFKEGLGYDVGMDDEGFTYDIDIDGDKYDFSFAERFTDDPEKKKKIMEMIMLEARLKQPTGRLLQDTIDTAADNALMSGLGSGDEDRFNREVGFMEDRAMDYGRYVEDDPSLTKSQRGEIMEMIASQTDPMLFRAQGGIADLDMRGGGASFGPGTGTSDDVPAMLSDGEFVMTANAVKNLGGGDRMVGAKRMYNMMNQLDPNSQSPGEMNVAGYG